MTVDPSFRTELVGEDIVADDQIACLGEVDVIDDDERTVGELDGSGRLDKEFKAADHIGEIIAVVPFVQSELTDETVGIGIVFIQPLERGIEFGFETLEKNFWIAIEEF